jgi:hypothetical protein
LPTRHGLPLPPPPSAVSNLARAWASSTRPATEPASPVSSASGRS